jgi:hypothetical protein
MTTAPHTPSAREILHLSKSVEHYTPPYILAAARQVMGSIELDPASCEIANRTIKAERFYTAADDGLSQPWVAATLWVNPPYGRDPKRNHQAFIRHLIPAYEDGDVGQAMLLVNASTGDKWFFPLWRFWICFMYERIAFLDEALIPQTSPTHNNVVVYFGTHGRRFADVFSALGRVVPPDKQPREIQHIPQTWQVPSNMRHIVVYPHLQVTRTAQRWNVRCPYCDRVHTHDAGEKGTDPRLLLGGRVAHCHRGHYELRELPPEVNV